MMTMDNGIETKRWEEFGLRPLADHVNPAQGRISHKTMHVPELSGTLDFGSEIEGRDKIEIPLNVLTDETDLSMIINQLNKFFFDEFKQPRYIKAIFDHEPNKYIWLKISSDFTPNRATLLKKMTIPFVQFDDNKYSITEANEILWGSTVIDFRSDYELGHTGSGAHELIITGNKILEPYLEGLAIMPFIEIDGSGTNVKITCASRTINIGNFSNIKIEIDTENYVVYKNGVETDFDLDEFYFVPGQSVSITGTSMNFKLTFHYRDIYM